LAIDKGSHSQDNNPPEDGKQLISILVAKRALTVVSSQSSPHPAVPGPDGGSLPATGSTEPSVSEEPTASRVPSLTPTPAGPFPQPFGRYVLSRALGSGGMATVYLAHDTLLDRDVAVKIPHASCAQNPKRLQRFHREGIAAARLSHPNLCPVLDLGEWEGIVYLTMPYIEGRPLSECAIADPLEAARLVRVLALAMAEAHRHNVVHRDLSQRNVLVTTRGEPVIVDFGIALLLDAEPLTEPGDGVPGTLAYMSPERVEDRREALGVPCDIFALGVILYRLLTGRMPFTAAQRLDLALQIVGTDPVPPSQLSPDLPSGLEAVCLKALAKRVEDRFSSMTELADSLGEVLAIPRPEVLVRPIVLVDNLRFVFVGMGERAPDWSGPQDRLWLDVGNDLRPGVLDHHHLTAGTGSAASFVLAYPAFLDRSVIPGRQPDAPFTLVLHEKPDLDTVSAVYLASCYLATKAFPTGAEALARYTDEVDDGIRGARQDNPFDLYAAFQQLADRLLRRTRNTPHEVWQDLVRGGVRLVAYVVEEALTRGIAVPEVDAFTCPGLFDAADRASITNDLERYRRKLANPRTHARYVRLRLPGQFGGPVEIDTLLVRDVQDMDDPERSVFFKDWARTDQVSVPHGRGFAALCVFCSEGMRQARRAILSVTPDCNASLRGLGALLDRAESHRRRQIYGVDDRVVEPARGTSEVPRPGYANSDPWYDGRAHRYTIVDSPRAGTILTAEDIERIFLEFGGLSPT
jgi:hypothetical protein